ncbi:MAG: glycosyltransferase [Syntrophaceae bacterium]
MEFDILVATRNRQSVLEISLPLMISQEILPSKFIFIDSSDDHLLLRRTVERIFNEFSPASNIQIIRSAPGLARQRNCGLRYTRAPVIFFPDDDALWFRGMARAVMSIYERDSREVIGAVCPADSPAPPPEAPNIVTSSHDGSGGIFNALGKLMNRFEDRFLMDPIYIEGFSRNAGRTAPEWLPEEDAEVFGPMTGFQMSFRTDVIRMYGFDESLGRYSLFEDRDASLSVLKERLIVCTKKGRVFHFRVPGKRTDDFEWGIINMLNRAYVVCKHSAPGSEARRKLNGYCLFRLAVYLLRARSQPGRQRIRGAWKAMACFPRLVNTPQSELTGCFVQLREECLKGRI